MLSFVGFERVERVVPPLHFGLQENKQNACAMGFAN